MILEILGIKRVFGLALGVGANVVMALFLYLYLIPAVDSRTNELNSLRGENSARSAEVQNLRQEIEAFEGQKVAFEDLKRLGFFSTQDRVMAREKIDEIRTLSRLLSIRYRVEPAAYTSDDLIAKARHVIVSSPLSVTLEAIEDKDVYRFLYLMETVFPGHVSLEEISLQKKAEVTQPILRQIGTGVPVVLVGGEARFVWRTVIPQDQASGLSSAGSEGGQ